MAFSLHQQSVLLLALTINVAFGQNPTKFAMMEVKSRSGSTDVCVNVQKFNGGAEVPEEWNEETPFRLLWWDFHFGQTAICTAPRAPYRYHPREMVPMDYLTRPDELAHACRFPAHLSSPLTYQLNLARGAGVRAFLYLVSRGTVNVNGSHDYLHSEFCNAEAGGISEGVGTYGSTNQSVFFVYKDTFNQFVQPKMREQGAAEFRFRKPGHYFDFGILLMWLLVLISVGLGALWSAKEAKEHFERSQSEQRDQQDGANVELKESAKNGDAEQPKEEPQQQQSGSADQQQTMKKREMLLKLCFWLACVIVIVIVLLIAYYFHALIIAIIWAILGIFCVSKGLFAICKYLIFPGRRGEQRALFTFKGIRLTPMGLLCYGIAILICVPWLLFRHHRLAFILLDLMDIAIAAFLIKYLTCNSLKSNTSLKYYLICSLLLFLLVPLQLLLNLFRTPELICQLTAPIETEKDPIGSFFVPMFNDPLSVCWDVEVERGYRHLVLAMFSVVCSALFLPFWFYIDFINDYKKLPYGLVAFGAYAILLLVALFLELWLFTGLNDQLSLLMLIPVPPIAGSIFALIRKTFGKLWKGQLKL